MLPLSKPTPKTDKHKPSPLNLFSTPSISRTKAPHIRTPLATSTSGSTSYFPNMSAIRTPGIPRAVTRLLLVVGLLGSVLFLFQISKGGVEEGVWDASSYSDRRGSSPHSQGGLGAVKKRIDAIRNPAYTAPAVPPVVSGKVPRPNLARQNYTLPRPTHSGVSRKAVMGAPDKYTTAPLPTIDEAWQWLHPRLRETKMQVPSIPREHQLWSPVFSPALTEEMKLRYTHLRMDWDEERNEWVPANKRYYFTTVCRQVAGESSWESVVICDGTEERIANTRYARGLVCCMDCLGRFPWTREHGLLLDGG